MKMNLLLSLTFAVFCLPLCNVYGQSEPQPPTAVLTACFTDGATKAPLSMVSVQVAGANEEPSYYFTGDDGCIKVSGLPFGDYVLNARSLSYEDVTLNFTVDKEEVDLGYVEMEANSTLLKEHVVEAVAMRTSLKGDTLVYNAAAFKVANDANLSKLLSKMPGISIDSQTGGITAQGQEVRKVLIDGKEFYRDDPAKTAELIPAEMVDKVEVYDSLSEHAELTGIDDGEGYKAMNIVTKEDKRVGLFGKFEGRYGTGDTYKADFDLTMFNDKRMFSVYTRADNTSFSSNSYGDAAEGMRSMSFMGSFYGYMTPGRQTLFTGGVTASDAWGKKQRFNVDAGYSYLHVKAVEETLRQVWNMTDSDVIWYTENRGDARANFNSHTVSVGGKLDADGTKLEIAASLSLSDDNQFSGSRLEQQRLFPDGTSEPFQKRDFRDDSASDSWSGRFGVNFGQRLSDSGRTIAVSLGGSYANDASTGDPRNYFYFPPYSDLQSPDSLFVRRNKTDNYSYSVNNKVTYTEPLTEKLIMSVEYGLNHTYADNDRRSYLWDDILHQYELMYDTDLSSIYNSGYWEHNVGPGIKYASDKLTFNGSVYYKNSSIRNRQTLPYDIDRRYSFNLLAYNAMIKYRFNPKNNLTVNVRSSNRNPEIAQLLEIPNFDNPEVVTLGNSSLKPTNYNNIYVNYLRTDPEKGTTFNAYLSGSYSNNSIVSSTTTGADVVIPNSGGLVLGEGNRLVQFVNLKGKPQWSLASSVGYAFPVKFMKSNLDMSAGYRYREYSSIYNSRRAKMKSDTYELDIMISSNTGPDLDFRIGLGIEYSITDGSIVAAHKTRFLDNYLWGGIDYVFWGGIALHSNLSYGFSRDYNENRNRSRTVINISLGKKLFKDEMGEIGIYVNNILDDGISDRRMVSSQSIVNMYHYGYPGRSFGVRFKYSFRNLKAVEKGQGMNRNNMYF